MFFRFFLQKHQMCLLTLIVFTGLFVVFHYFYSLISLRKLKQQYTKCQKLSDNLVTDLQLSIKYKNDLIGFLSEKDAKQTTNNRVTKRTVKTLDLTSSFFQSLTRTFKMIQQKRTTLRIRHEMIHKSYVEEMENLVLLVKDTVKKFTKDGETIEKNFGNKLTLNTLNHAQWQTNVDYLVSEKKSLEKIINQLENRFSTRLFEVIADYFQRNNYTNSFDKQDYL